MTRDLILIFRFQTMHVPDRLISPTSRSIGLATFIRVYPILIPHGFALYWEEIHVIQQSLDAGA